MNVNATMLWNAEIFAGNICTKPEKTVFRHSTGGYSVTFLIFCGLF